MAETAEYVGEIAKDTAQKLSTGGAWGLGGSVD